MLENALAKALLCNVPFHLRVAISGHQPKKWLGKYPPKKITRWKAIGSIVMILLLASASADEVLDDSLLHLDSRRPRGQMSSKQKEFWTKQEESKILKFTGWANICSEVRIGAVISFGSRRSRRWWKWSKVEGHQQSSSSSSSSMGSCENLLLLMNDQATWSPTSFLGLEWTLWGPGLD